MGKKRKGDDGDGGEQLISLKKLPGPLGPWRFSLAVAVTAATTGVPLIHAAQSGNAMDAALLRSFAIGFLTWFLLGRINRVLAAAAFDRASQPTTSISNVTDLPTSAVSERSRPDDVPGGGKAAA